MCHDGTMLNLELLFLDVTDGVPNTGFSTMVAALSDPFILGVLPNWLHLRPFGRFLHGIHKLHCITHSLITFPCSPDPSDDDLVSPL